MRYHDLHDFHSNIAVCKISLSQDRNNHARAYLVLPLSCASNGDLLVNTRSPLIPTVYYTRSRSIGLPEQVRTAIRLLTLQQRVLGMGGLTKKPYGGITNTDATIKTECGTIAYLHGQVSDDSANIEMISHVNEATGTLLGKLLPTIKASRIGRSVDEKLESMNASDYEYCLVAPKYVKSKNASVVKATEQLFEERTLKAIQNIVINRLKNYGLSLSSSNYNDPTLYDYFHLLSLNALKTTKVAREFFRSEFSIEAIHLLSDGQLNGSLMQSRKRPFISDNFDVLSDADRVVMDFIDLNNINLDSDEPLQLLNLPFVFGYQF
ncbi:hypothetical protein [Photobacterium leiognathi]|uniref:hypothetical protein n=1 Tax=Photobacterium leiognathi TaxID=553611 RepID=UPI002981EBED|nr:hypothetical protein [Photobacterium leiognathi]